MGGHIWSKELTCRRLCRVCVCVCGLYTPYQFRYIHFIVIMLRRRRNNQDLNLVTKIIISVVAVAVVADKTSARFSDFEINYPASRFCFHYNLEWPHFKYYLRSHCTNGNFLFVKKSAYIRLYKRRT